MHLSGITIQVRVDNFTEGIYWYQQLLQRPADFVPHHGFSEWELLSGSNCWLQVAEGTPTPGSGPLRLGVNNVDHELARLQQELGVKAPTVYQTPDKKVRYCTFADPFGNGIGLVEEKMEDD